jgi:hypothetical protein
MSSLWTIRYQDIGHIIMCVRQCNIPTFSCKQANPKTCVLCLLELLIQSLQYYQFSDEERWNMAELAKLVENSFRDVTIAFSNEISMVCEKLDVDCKHLIELCNLHPRVDILRPSIGAQRALSCGLILIFCTIPLPAIHH